MEQPTKLTLDWVLNNSTENYGNRVALSDLGAITLTFSELKQKVNSVTQYLRDEGIVPGDKVAILGENCVNWSISYFAITTMGAVGVPIMTEFQAPEVHHVLRHSESKAIFVSSKFYEKVDDCTIEVLKSVILLDDFSIVPPCTEKDRFRSMVDEGLKEFSKIKFAAMKFVGLAKDEIKEDDLALILYTSGTTGHSKGVMLTHKNVVFDAYSTTILVDVEAGARFLSILPLFHTIESTLGLVTPLMVGASITYLNKPPTASILLPALKKVKPTVMVSVPLVIDKIFKLRILPEIRKKAVVRALYKIPLVRKKIHAVAGKKLLETFGGELKMFSIGGAAMPADTERFLTEAKFPYACGYGLTETSPLVTGTGPAARKFGSAGHALHGMEVKIDNPDPETGEGEVIIKAPNVMKGYYRDPEKTKEVITEDGWFRSGDLGIIDNDGYLFIKGRSKNVIIGSNGKNIYPEEIESIIAEQAYVLESLVLNREDKLVAKVYLDSDAIDQEFELANKNETDVRKIIQEIFDAILKNVNERVATFSRLNKIVEQLEPFEKTPTQKIKRYLYL